MQSAVFLRNVVFEHLLDVPHALCERNNVLHEVDKAGISRRSREAVREGQILSETARFLGQSGVSSADECIECVE